VAGSLESAIAGIDPASARPAESNPTVSSPALPLKGSRSIFRQSGKRGRLAPDKAGGWDDRLLQRQSVIGDGHFLLVNRRRHIPGREHSHTAANQHEKYHENAEK
jgi:hypothetical protein